MSEPLSTPSPPVISIVHELPGRLRFRLSSAVRDRKALEAGVYGHEGIEQVECTPITGSVLVCFDHEVVTREEIAMRLGVAYSADQAGGPIRIFSNLPKGEISDSAFYAGLLLAVATVGRLVAARTETRRMLDTIAGVGTAGAVVGHGWREVEREGAFDPEVLSVVYLLVAMVRQGGAALPAALFTWLTTFARHLVEAPAAGVELRPTQMTCDDTGPAEVVVGSVYPSSPATMAMTLLSSGLRFALTGGMPAGTGALLQDIGAVARRHDEVIEGLGDLRRGIPVRIQP